MVACDGVFGNHRERGRQTRHAAPGIPGKRAGGSNVWHRGYNLRGIQWHGYNDNHVALGTSALILGGELVDRRDDVEAGRASLMQIAMAAPYPQGCQPPARLPGIPGAACRVCLPRSL